MCVVSEGEMEPHGVFREVTALCTNKDHDQLTYGHHLKISNWAATGVLTFSLIWGLCNSLPSDAVVEWLAICFWHALMCAVDRLTASGNGCTWDWDAVGVYFGCFV